MFLVRGPVFYLIVAVPLWRAEVVVVVVGGPKRRIRVYIAQDCEDFRTNFRIVGRHAGWQQGWSNMTRRGVTLETVFGRPLK